LYWEDGAFSQTIIHEFGLKLISFVILSVADFHPQLAEILDRASRRCIRAASSFKADKGWPIVAG
jgi:hypothetical protein